MATTVCGSDSRKISKLGLFLVATTGGTAIAISTICAPFITPAFRRICLPYVPATTKQIENVLAGLKGRTGSLIDLGSGDGRIVLSAAQKGFQAHGIELNPWLVYYSRLASLAKGLSSRTAFFRKDLWKYSLKSYDNVVIFGVEQMMGDIEKKFLSEMRKDSMVLACRFPLPTVNPIRTIGEGVDTVWVYKPGYWM